MSPSEIKTFEDFWQYLWSIIYKIIEFFKGAEGGGNTIGTGSDAIDIEPVKPIY